MTLRSRKIRRYQLKRSLKLRDLLDSLRASLRMVDREWAA